MTFEWGEKVVLITGAAKGIGAAVVKILVENENVKHVTILDIDDEALILQNSLNSKHGKDKVKYIKCDITNEDQLIDAYKDVMDRYGRLDVVVNNAALGLIERSPILVGSQYLYWDSGCRYFNDVSFCGHLEDKANLASTKLGVTGRTALCTSTLKALELMRMDEGGQGGTIINISSIGALLQHPLLPIYFSTKSAVLQFSNCLGSDYYYSRTGVRIITMCFGATSTGLLSQNNFGCFDKLTHESRVELLKIFTTQKSESAANSLVEAYKKGQNGSTWLSVNDKPVRDITENFKKAYEILSEGI
ncbi:alcohol dehydrogenase 1-like [Aphomia sociella]